MMSNVSRPGRRLRARQDGAAALELAIVLPLLIVLAVAVTEFGRVYLTSIRVANAAMAGAHFGAQNSGSGDSVFIGQVAREDAGDASLVVSSNRACRCPDSETTVPCSTVCAGYGNPQFFVAVTTSKNVSLLFRYPGLPSTIAVSRTATMRVQ